jgi:hypothetical protein
MGYSVPEVESALQNFIKSYPQPYPQAGQGRQTGQAGQQQAPPVVEIHRLPTYTPQQKIFAKVKAVIWL